MQISKTNSNMFVNPDFPLYVKVPFVSFKFFFVRFGRIVADLSIGLFLVFDC